MLDLVSFTPMHTPEFYRKAAEEIFKHALVSVQPENLIHRTVSRNNHQLRIADQILDLNKVKRVFILGAGKATAPMAQAIEEIMGDFIHNGLIIVKHGHSLSLKNIKSIEAGHPVPDDNGILGTAQVLKLVQKLDTDDLVIMLLSGGGSALLVDLPLSTSLEELQACFTLLLKSGATIEEVNTVRKHLSLVKGGQLAKQVFPAKLITLILSDVIGDPLDVIASGPTVADSTTFKDAWAVIEKYNLESTIPYSIHQHLQQGMTGILPETPKAGDSIFKSVHNYIIGSNTIALESAQQRAVEMGFTTTVVGSAICGEARTVAIDLVEQARKIALDTSYAKPACLLMGGETTVIVQGNGKGGRNQEFALAAALALQAEDRIVILSAGTDGTDGPTDAAGAVVDAFTLAQAHKKEVEAETFLSKNDSYHFFQEVGGHIITGPTRTNVMDIMLAIIY